VDVGSLSDLRSHGGFTHNQQWWEWASRDNHRRWITGTDSLEHFDRSGWHDARQLIALCPDYRTQTLLEWGCGSGRVTQYLSFLFRKLWAIDIAPGMIEELQALHLPDTTVYVTGGADLPPRLAVDVVYSCLCWMHNRKADLEPIFRACRSVLGPGGPLIFQLPIYDVPRDPDSFIDVACWTPAELLALAARTGFAVKRMHGNPGAFSIEAIGPHHFSLHEFRAIGPARPA
jgi:SAM-dependent methyltransferase